MSTHNTYPCRQGILFLSLAAAFGSASAADDDVAQMIKPDSTISVGLGAVSGNKEDRAFFGQYNGMRKNSSQLILDIDYLRRDDASGTWTNLSGRNLGNENRELGFSQQKQGDWRYFFEYGELVRNYSNTINTNVSGIGTNNLVVNTVGNPTATPTPAGLQAAQGTGSNEDLKTTRKSLGLGGDKWLTPNLQLELSFRNEDKTGARLFGQGSTCTATRYQCTGTTGYLLLLPEPINSSTRQFELKLNYANDKLALNGGYYGTFYVNKYGSLNTTIATPANMWNPNGSVMNATVLNATPLMQLPLALPPDNQAHQFSLAGTYAITPTTRATFKYAFTRLTQNESFDGMGLVGGPRGALDAVIDTTVGQVGITARPMPKLSLVANLRYEQKSDKTPIDVYRDTATNNGLIRTNNPSSHTKIKGKLEAAYQLPQGYRATAGIDYDMRDLGRPTGTNDTSGQATAIRAKNDEIGYRAELRKSLSDTLNGAVSVGHSSRNGTKWMTATNGVAPTIDDGAAQALGTAGFGLFPLFWMDLKRDKLKGSVDWAPINRLSLQASVEGVAEHYFAPSMRGARDGKTTNINFDAAYAVSDNWKVNGWYSRGDTILDINGSTGAYMAGLRQLGHNLGLGVRGAPTGKLEVGADFTFSYEVNRTGVGVIGTSTQPNGLPAAAFRQLNLNMFGKYALDKNADIRVNLVHQRYYSNEWFWNNNGTSFFYSDGTTVTQKDQQNVTFIGAAYIYKFQ
ncbi:MAG: MtrB/PioB family decaheme-associated outer membrane protein [Sulfuritalea sp.]